MESKQWYSAQFNETGLAENVSWSMPVSKKQTHYRKKTKHEQTI
jgi:hypothetical protein